MKIIDVVQGTVEWEMARLGIPTASCFDKIVSPKKLLPSSTAVSYRNQLLAEWFLGYPLEFGSGNNGWTQRGTEMEAEARAFFEFRYDLAVRQVGLCLRDDEMVGCSPDGLIGEDEGVELKCPAIHTHIGYMLSPDTLLDEYRSQTQGGLYVTGRKRWHLMSYHPKLPPVRLIIEPDPKHIAALNAALGPFVASLLAGRELLEPHRATPAEPVAA
jgi:hypothetical protein